jgi:uncharacterized membrane protein YkgB
MVKGILIVAVVLLIGLATQADGMLRAIFELSAFLATASLVFTYKKSKRASGKIEPEEL